MLKLFPHFLQLDAMDCGLTCLCMIAKEVFTVIPVSESRILGKAMLPVARSGKVKAGQKVNIRLDNFPDSEFGMLNLPSRT